jgi:cytochrome c-type biogenesis protein CcmF
MITEFGHYALVAAFAVALLQASLPMIGARTHNGVLMNFAGQAAVVQALLVVIAFAALTHAFVTSDFSVAVVAQNSHSLKPMLYKVAGVWGNHEGSLLLWILILAVFGAAVAIIGTNLPPLLKARALAVQAMISVGFILFILLTSNPFHRLDPPPLDGNGLNPLLQDPGLAFHPPMLYLGYVGFSMAFSFAVAGLIEGKVDAAWARWVRPWTLVAWIALTLGITGGSWWAYYTLGWGGWWYWDPTENASFMPWLAGTALLHSASVVEKRAAMKSWTVFLAIVTFGFSLLGTFLVRSGVLTSVHSFASDPARGAFILLLLLIMVGGSFILFAIRAPSMQSGGLFAPISREGSLLFNNVLMATGAATVLLGTLYPLIADALDLGKVSVGPPFFNAVFLPLMTPMIVAMAVGPMLSWKRADFGGLSQRLTGMIVITILVAAGVWILQGGSAGPWWAAGGMAVAAWLLVGTTWDMVERLKVFRQPLSLTLRRAIGLPRATWGMAFAHLGVGVVIIGMTGSSAWKLEAIQNQHINETVSLGGWDVTLKGVEETQGPNYTASHATFDLSRDGKSVAVLTPEKRQFVMPPRPATNAAIRSTPFGDVYVVVGDQAGDDSWVTRIYVNPLVPFLWIGAAMMGFGGFLSLTDRRHRIGVPKAAGGKAA